MGYSDVLTRQEYEATAISQEILRYLEVARFRLGLEKSEMNVLDWGCGRGNHVLFLREAGYNAFGVEISQDTLERGKSLIGEFGYDPDHLLRRIESTGQTAHPDGFFHFLFSYQVLEHVEDIDRVSREISRLTRLGGFGFHMYPGKWRPVEAHLFMPFVHWLPKNELCHWVIRACVSLGIEPYWQDLQGLSKADKAATYFGFIKSATFYRSFEEIQQSFLRAGLAVQPVVMDHPSLARFSWLPRQWVEPLVLAFKTVEMLTEKVGSASH